MPESDRVAKPKARLTAWIVGAVGIVSVAAAGGYGLFQQAIYREEATQQASDYARHAARQIQQACLRSPAPEKTLCFRNARAEYDLKTRDNRREYDDLVAQRRSALWTFIMGFAALIGIALSAVGVVLVKQTFDETRRTNRIAMRANARATRQAIAAAKETAEALKIARRDAAATAKLSKVAAENGERELRAYLDFETVKVVREPNPSQPGKFWLGVSVRTKNFGKTPADELEMNVVLSIIKDGKVTNRTVRNKSGLGSICPNDIVRGKDYLLAPEDYWAALGNRSLRLRVELRIDYIDAFKRRRLIASHYENQEHESEMVFTPGTRQNT